DCVAITVNTPPHAVDPPVAEGFFDRFRPRHARLAGRLFVVTDQDLSRRPVMGVEPLPKVGGRFEINGVRHWAPSRIHLAILPLATRSTAPAARTYPLTCHKFGRFFVMPNFINDATTGIMTVMHVMVTKSPPW